LTCEYGLNPGLGNLNEASLGKTSSKMRPSAIPPSPLSTSNSKTCMAFRVARFARSCRKSRERP